MELGGVISEQRAESNTCLLEARAEKGQVNSW